MKVSIVIPTYNRCENLKFLLESLKDLRLPDTIKCEVLVVDNNSTDSTKVITDSYLLSKHPKIRYIFEHRQGKSYALNTAVEQAGGDILVFTDDDCIPDPCWIMHIAKEFADDPSISVLGGRVELFDEGDKPVTISPYKDRTCISSPTQLYFPPLIIGCNMAVRRKVFDVVRIFDPLLGPGTRSGAVAEDIDFLYRVYKKKFKMVYTPTALVFHNHGRKTDAEADDVKRTYFIGRGAFYCKYLLDADPAILKMALSEIYPLTKTIVKGFILKKEFPLHTMLFKCLFHGGYSYLKSKSSSRSFLNFLIL